MDRVRTIAGPAGRRAAIAATGAGEVTVADAATVVVRAARGVRKSVFDVRKPGKLPARQAD